VGGYKFRINWFVRNFIQPTHKLDMYLLAYEKYMLINSINKKIYTPYMFKEHMSLLYVGRIKFFINPFLENSVQCEPFLGKRKRKILSFQTKTTTIKFNSHRPSIIPSTCPHCLFSVFKPIQNSLSLPLPFFFSKNQKKTERNRHRERGKAKPAHMTGP
jgi:hypothetical protein